MAESVHIKLFPDPRISASKVARASIVYVHDVRPMDSPARDMNLEFQFEEGSFTHLGNPGLQVTIDISTLQLQRIEESLPNELRAETKRALANYRLHWKG